MPRTPTEKNIVGGAILKAGLGESVARVEDSRLLTGQGRYTDDIDLPDQAYGVVLRSPIAHATIAGIDASAARDMPGVLAVLTRDELAEDGLGDIPCGILHMIPLKREDGATMSIPPYPVLAREAVKYAGQPVAFVVAETRAQALDAAEAIEVDYEELPAVGDIASALAPDAPRVWDDVPGNRSYIFAMGDKAKVDAAMEAAAHVVSMEIPVSRLIAAPMEPRAALGHYDAAEDRYTLYSGSQGPHRNRQMLAESIFRESETKFRVVSPDMGGGFGMRSDTYPEMSLVLWASRRVGRPVKWTGERTEAFISDYHGRDAVYSIDLGLDAEGNFLAARCSNLSGMGAFFSGVGPLPSFAFLGGLAGVYKTPAIWAQAVGVHTNTPPTAPYRGAGRPEAILSIESVIDKAADALGIDRIELRRKNLIPREEMPFQTGLAYVYDSGKFAENMDKAIEAADVAGFPARQAEAAERGKLRGLGVVNGIEAAGAVMMEGADLRFDPTGNLTVSIGTHSHGQGHETVFRQLIATKLGLDFERVRYVQGDTDLVPYGSGTFASRSMMMGGGAIASAADKIIEKGKRIAAHRMEAAVDDIEFADGQFTVAGTDKTLSIVDVARGAYIPPLIPPEEEAGLTAFSIWKDQRATFPNGCHVSEVEIDPETGSVELVNYVVVDDVGTVMNPMLLKGQMHGGVVQGLGQVFNEQILYDETAQLLTGSFMDYGMPRADELPHLEIISNPDPTPTHPLGVKGAGEAGTVGALACGMAAVRNALAQAGVTDFHMPATPGRIWEALNGSQRNAA